jgi:O-methyltransferase involved in polyketide biosynthesis
MRDTATPSRTATMVAALRAWAKWLPHPLCDLARDPFGAVFAGGAYAYADALFNAAPALPRFLARHTAFGRMAAHMAVRTRNIDDALLSFHAAGGRQVILLGAGMDARPCRLSALRDCAVFEVDSPGSQAAKLAALARAHVAPPPMLRFISHDFEAERMDALLQKMRDAGLNSNAPVCIVWEARKCARSHRSQNSHRTRACIDTPPAQAVSMYLSHEAVADTVVAARTFGGAGSQFVFTYLSVQSTRRSLWQRIRLWLHLLLSPAGLTFYAVATSAGERFKHTFSRGTLAPWLAARGWTLQTDKTCTDIATDLGVPEPLLRRYTLSDGASWAAGGMQHRHALAAVLPPTAAVGS